MTSLFNWRSAPLIAAVLLLFAGGGKATAQASTYYLGTTQDIGPASVYYGGATGNTINYSTSKTVNQQQSGSITGKTTMTWSQIVASVAATLNASVQQTWNVSVSQTIYVPPGRRVSLRPAIVYENYYWEYRVWGVKVATGTYRKFQSKHVLQAWQ